MIRIKHAWPTNMCGTSATHIKANIILSVRKDTLGFEYCRIVTKHIALSRLCTKYNRKHQVRSSTSTSQRWSNKNSKIFYLQRHSWLLHFHIFKRIWNISASFRELQTYQPVLENFKHISQFLGILLEPKSTGLYKISK